VYSLTTTSQKKVTQIFRGRYGDNIKGHSILYNARYHGQCYEVDNQEGQGPEGLDKVVSG
jgi:hypothetical protein